MSTLSSPPHTSGGSSGEGGASTAEGNMPPSSMATTVSAGDPAQTQQPAVTFKAFLDKMRHPAAADLVRSIKNFIQSVLDRSSVCDTDASRRPPDPDAQAQAVQLFLDETEAAFRQHPLFRDAREEELDAAGEGLEKYLMTKLHDVTFGVTKEDREQDEHLSALLGALRFVRPEHLDIPERARNESTYEMAMKELNKINGYKAPRDKLVCIMNCCYIINNLLGVAARSGSEGVSGSNDGFGADDFLPILIFIVIHAGVDKLESNLQYIQRFRKSSRLASEAAYFYTNVMSATSFISTVNADSLSIDKKVFIENMRAAGIPFPDADAEKGDTTAGAGGAEEAAFPPTAAPFATAAESQLRSTGGDGPSTSVAEQLPQGAIRQQAPGRLTGAVVMPPLSEILDSIERLGVAAVKEMKGGELRNSYSYIDSSSNDLKVSDVSGLLVEYKELALRHECMARGIKAWHRQFSAAGASSDPAAGALPPADVQSTGGSSAGAVESSDLLGLVDYTSQQMPAGVGGSDTPPLIEMKEMGGM